MGYCTSTKYYLDHVLHFLVGCNVIIDRVVFISYVIETDIVALTSVVKKGGFVFLVGTAAGFFGCSFG